MSTTANANPMSATAATGASATAPTNNATANILFPNMAYQGVDQKKEDFRKYLEKNGIIDALTKVLVGLYEEPDKPDNPLDFIKQFLGGPASVDIEALKAENEELRKKVDELQEKVDQLSKGQTGPSADTEMTSAQP